MDGLLIIDKPEGWTSHDVVAKVRRILKTKRVGHTGTLDPFATGVLVLLIGKATRLAQFLDKDEKEYEAVVQFGFETDTGDRTGMRNADIGVRDEEVIERLAGVRWEDVLKDFRGEIAQVPPMYSAKKVAGKKLYELARKGKKVERSPIKVIISELELADTNQIRDQNSEIRIRVICSAGTYIRTLAEDIGRRIGIPAHLTELRRTRAGKFGLETSVTVADLESAAEPAAFLTAIEEAVSHLPKFVLSAERVEKTLCGLSTRTSGSSFSKDVPVRMLDKESRLIAIGTFEPAGSHIRPNIVIA